MYNLITILILSQLDHFGFAPISSPQVVGDSFQITIYAYDINNQIVSDYNGQPWVYSSINPAYCIKQVSFINGICTNNVMVTLAANMALICNDYDGHTGQSNDFDILASAPAKLLSIVPNEIYDPGTENGKYGPVEGQTAGVEFTIDIYLTDAWYNIVDTTNHIIRYNQTDQFVQGSQIQLVNGTFSLPFAFRTAGPQRVYFNDVTNPAIDEDSCSLITVYPGEYTNLLVLLPGETHLPGDTTNYEPETPGKSGEPDNQYVLETFPVIVYAADSMWNKTSTSGNTVTLRSNFPPLDTNPLTQYLSNGEAQFSVYFFQAEDNTMLKAENGSIQSYENYLDIEAKTTHIGVVVDPDTINAGTNALITATVYDRAGQPIEDKKVNFTVLGGGNGYIVEDNPYTNSLGIATAYFVCANIYFNELDTIGVTADDTTFLATCYVMVADSSIMEGEILAYPNPMGIEGQTMRFMYYLPHPCNVIFAIYDPFGNEVHQEHISTNSTGAQSGINTLEWNGRNDKGMRVSSGLYYVIIKCYTHTSTYVHKKIRVGVVW
ncbi:MAG: hypothetical protein JSV97_12985 [candidate division WOR-3 bacterium]|nr:MAG: hypothetical protein JSV97_12985 [candidate division WOR-3 bacterium]